MLSSNEVRQRKLILSDIRRKSLQLASLVGDERYPRKFKPMLSWRGRVYPLTRLGRLKRPLYLGADGYIYRVDAVENYHDGPEGSVRRAELKRRDFAGLVRVSQVLDRAIDDILQQSPFPFPAGIISEM